MNDQQTYDQCQLLHGDCLERMAEIPDGSVDMVMCDPPYGTTACKWDSVIPFEPMWEAYRRVCKKNAAIVLTASQPFTSALVMSNPKAFKHSWVWNKVRGTNFALTKFQPMKEHEDVVVFSNGGGKCPYFPQMESRRGNGVNAVGSMVQSNTKGGKESVTILPVGKRKKVSELRVPGSIQNFIGEKRGVVHPTQKPVALMEYLIKTYTNPGELVLDNTMGCGTTGVACIRTNRRFIGIEKDQEYFKTACERIKRELTQGDLFHSLHNK